MSNLKTLQETAKKYGETVTTSRSPEGWYDVSITKGKGVAIIGFVHKLGCEDYTVLIREVNEWYEPCEVCEGEGSGYFSCCSGELVTNDHNLCPDCHDHVGESECNKCNGTGYQLKN